MTCFVITYKREIRKWTNIRMNNLLLFKVYIHHIPDRDSALTEGISPNKSDKKSKRLIFIRHDITT